MSAVRVITSDLQREAVFRTIRKINKKDKIADEIWNFMVECGLWIFSSAVDSMEEKIRIGGRSSQYAIETTIPVDLASVVGARY